MKRPSLFFAIFLILAVALSACTPAARTAQDSYNSPQEEFFAVATEAPQPVSDLAGGWVDAPGTVGNAQISSLGEGYQPAAERMVIHDANLSIVVVDPAAAMDNIVIMSEGMGGYVVSSYLYKAMSPSGIEIPAATITVRIPSAQLNTAVRQIKTLVENPEKDILTETITGEDITKQYADLESRLANLEAAAEKLNEIMDAATDTEAVLEVYQELIQVTEEIELIKGQMQYYAEAAAMSKITVTIQAQEAVKPITVAGWEPKGVLRDAIQSLINFWQGFINFLIQFFVYFVPVLATIALPFFLVFLIVRAIVRRNRAKKAARRAAEAAPKS
jgi:hypothetical protein